MSRFMAILRGAEEGIHEEKRIGGAEADMELRAYFCFDLEALSVCSMRAIA